MTERLQLKNVSRSFGGLKAVTDVSLSVNRGEIFGIIGPNGAGKTTLFNLIVGVYKLSGGGIVLDGRNITNLPSDAVARAKVGRTFQAPRLFKSETVMDNLKRSLLFKTMTSPFAYFRNRNHVGASADEESIRTVSSITGLDRVIDQEAGSLPYGLQKALGVGMALVQKPTLLLMDEPAAGLNPTEKVAMGDLIEHISRSYGIDIIVIEHDMRLIMTICDRIAVLNRGHLVSVGTPEQIRAHEGVVEAYLGQDYEFA